MGMGLKEEKILLVCEPDPVWCKQLGAVLQKKQITLREVQEWEELQQAPAGCQGILISVKELNSMIQWGTFGEDGTEGSPFVHFKQIKQLEKKYGVPIIVLMEERNYEAEYRYLQMGAAECFDKELPLFLLAERIQRIIPKQEKDSYLCFGEVWMDKHHCCVCSAKGGNTVLTEKEFAVLKLLFRQQGALLSRTELQKNIWQEVNERSSHCLDTVVKQLRKKLLCHPVQIKTIYRKGYYMDINYKFC